MKYSYLIGAGGNPVTYKLYEEKSRKRQVIAGVLSAIVILGVIVSQVAIHVRQDSVKAQGLPSGTNNAEIVSDAPKKPAAEPLQPKKIDLSQWLSSHPGEYGITIYDDNGNTLAEHNPDDRYFMASIYKLYVAYIGYQKLDKGEWRDDIDYVKNLSRSKCLYEMIHSSDNACGEKMMTELGKKVIEAKLSEYGFKNTSIASFETSAGDVSLILARLQSGQDLRAESRQKLLDSMQNQIYREGLPKGFNGWIVEDKVGFRGKDEYHDVGIIIAPGGKKTYVVSVLSSKAGAKNIASLGEYIKSSL